MIKGKDNPAKRPEARAKISFKMKDRKMSLEWRQKLSKAKKGNTNALGHKVSKRVKLLISNKLQGRFTESESPHWKGNNIKEESGRVRARKKYKTKFCSICKKTKEKVDLVRHHKDKNTTNNNENNIQILCRSCHVRFHKLQE